MADSCSIQVEPNPSMPLLQNQQDHVNHEASMAESSMVHPSTPPPANPLMNIDQLSLPQANPPPMVPPSTNPSGSLHHPTTAEPIYYILTNPPIPFPCINDPSGSGPNLPCDITWAQPPHPPPNQDPADNMVQQQIQQPIFIMSAQPPPMNPKIGVPPPPPMPPREHSNHDLQETQQTPPKSQTTCQDLIFFLVSCTIKSFLHAMSYLADRPKGVCPI
ncbi:hypothetical protein FH972_006533 [Carpinus fangiana]|uniref:Uncharacterized protein n=1 Tax=Carpinus fangiana TaxID=176857 RepID=A0A5N6QVI9_9ROSI|nr:hypothetical protein FH972_006533 [Carpinus fangiana]